MKRFSHILSFLAVALFVLSTGSVAKANSVDPQVGLGGDPATCEFAVTESSTSQMVNNAPTGCIFDVTNAIPGATLTSVTITILSDFFGKGTSNLTCHVYANEAGFGSPSPFSIGTPNADGTACTFSGPPVSNTGIILLSSTLVPPPTGGVNPGGSYGVELGSGNSPFLDPTGQFVLGSLNLMLSATVPEPGTLLLLGTGLAAIIANKKRLKTAKHLV
jgi:hypothetical protein